MGCAAALRDALGNSLGNTLGNALSQHTASHEGFKATSSSFNPFCLSFTLVCVFFPSAEDGGKGWGTSGQCRSSYRLSTIENCSSKAEYSVSFT